MTTAFKPYQRGFWGSLSSLYALYRGLKKRLDEPFSGTPPAQKSVVLLHGLCVEVITHSRPFTGVLNTGEHALLSALFIYLHVF